MGCIRLHLCQMTPHMTLTGDTAKPLMSHTCVPVDYAEVTFHEPRIYLLAIRLATALVQGAWSRTVRYRHFLDTNYACCLISTTASGEISRGHPVTQPTDIDVIQEVSTMRSGSGFWIRATLNLPVHHAHGSMRATTLLFSPWEAALCFINGLGSFFIVQSVILRYWVVQLTST